MSKTQEFIFRALLFSYLLYEFNLLISIYSSIPIKKGEKSAELKIFYHISSIDSILYIRNGDYLIQSKLIFVARWISVTYMLFFKCLGAQWLNAPLPSQRNNVCNFITKNFMAFLMRTCLKFIGLSSILSMLTLEKTWVIRKRDRPKVCAVISSKKLNINLTVVWNFVIMVFPEYTVTLRKSSSV